MAQHYGGLCCNANKHLSENANEHADGLPLMQLGNQQSMVYALQVMWAVCVYVEAVSVLPQLRMMQKAKVVEKFTAHYVFALGVSRFISCAHWILQIIDGDSFLLQAIGSGIWPAMVLLSEIVQTGILADFWYDLIAVCVLLCIMRCVCDCKVMVTHNAMLVWAKHCGKPAGVCSV